MSLLLLLLSAVLVAVVVRMALAARSTERQAALVLADLPSPRLPANPPAESTGADVSESPPDVVARDDAGTPPDSSSPGASDDSGQSVDVSVQVPSGPDGLNQPGESPPVDGVASPPDPNAAEVSPDGTGSGP